MADTADQIPVPQRVPSGIEGLDRILHGGFFQGRSYLLMGPPGAGKTILSNQLSFHHVANGGRALYLSLLAETSSGMLANFQSFSFFTLNPIADALFYLSGYAALEQEGLEGLIALIRTEMRRHRATFLVIDGTMTARQAAPSEQTWKKFLHDVHVTAEITRCTTFLLTPFDEDSAAQPEQTMVDGLIALTTRSVDLRSVRELQVLKFRGSDFLEGRHHYAITKDGLVVYPRTESILAFPGADLSRTLVTPEQPARMRVGIDHLDEMLRGGVLTGSMTLLLGASGTGKTLLGSHFLIEGAAQGQKGLYFGFNETPAQLVRTMSRFRLDVPRYIEIGQLEVLWQSPIQDSLDVLAERLLEAIQRQGTRRLFLDGLLGFQRTVASAERLDLFLATLFTALHVQDVTVMCAVELPALFTPKVVLPATFSGITGQVENLLLLRYVELHSQLYRLISIMKMRESSYDPSIREFRITEQGIEVAPTFASAQAILTDIAHPVAPSGASSAFAADSTPKQGRQP